TLSNFWINQKTAQITININEQLRQLKNLILNNFEDNLEDNFITNDLFEVDSNIFYI
ncbi:20921_t:CDS:2, partial [Cetraspora pellucida]